MHLRGRLRDSALWHAQRAEQRACSEAPESVKMWLMARAGFAPAQRANSMHGTSRPQRRQLMPSSKPCQPRKP